jgi:glycolate oxidase FAD binding subunit
MVAKLSPAVQAFYDWAGGLVWVAAPAGRDGCAGEIRSAVATVGGHATLVRAAAAVREAVDPFPPQEGAEAALAQRIKHAFDPRGVLNPGRMWAGM